MLTLEEYKAANQPSVRRQIIRAVVFVALFFLPMGGLVALNSKLKQDDSLVTWLFDHGMDTKPALLGAVGLIILLLFLVFGSVLWLMGRFDRRDKRLLCPHCLQRLKREVEFAGFCPACGERALLMTDEPTASAAGLPERSLLTIHDFNSACVASLKHVGIMFGVLILALFLYLGVVGAIVANWREPISDWVSQHFRTDRPQDVYGPIALLPSLLIFPGGLVFLAIREHKRGPDPRITCPQCRKELIQARWWVTATRRCPKCGACILADPDVESAGTQAALHWSERGEVQLPRVPLHRVEDFHTAARSFSRWFMLL